MPNIILKKTFKVKPAGFQVANEKTFSFHGGVAPTMIEAVNQKLASIRLYGRSNRIQFVLGPTGHYQCAMNHDFQKYHEEDAVVAILDVMELLGWTFRFQYDSESHSTKVNGASFTSRELFIFSRST
ncbi:expressed unknown protein [Seminavis robusta]|uniref:Uncharacterized protein n=1 Tax=Seminavis robusta TaxID=568900 RepID=A0A9N8DES2_9STRA|nr:expressed unknown protein [Seminavis robusta]|eukprot:Sro89_g046810.1 n/a (127) ;mRNA; f:26311-26691